MNQPKSMTGRYFPPVAFIVFLIFWFALFIGSGSMFSGYHFTDDHDILTMYADLMATGGDVIGVTRQLITWDWIVADRLKPIYFLHKILQIWVFGANFNMLLAYYASLAVLTSLLLSVFAKRTGLSTSESILYPFMTLVGPQAIIWWSLGPNETIGMVMLSASLLFMAYCDSSGAKRVICEVLFVFFAALMSLSKESFIILIPALIFWKIWLDSERGALGWIGAARRNILSALALLIIMSAELFTIIHWLGTSGYSKRAGGLHGFEPISYLLTAVKTTLSVSSVGFGLITLVGIGLILIFQESEGRTLFSRGMRFLRDFTPPIILFILIAGPQFVLYARSGFYGRYWLPMLFGYSTLLIYLLRFLRINGARYFIKPLDADTKRVPAALICVVSALLLLLVGAVLLYDPSMSAALYEAIGKPTNALGDLLKPGLLAALAGVLLLFIYRSVLTKGARSLPVLRVLLLLTVLSLSFKMTNFLQLRDFSTEGRQFASLLQTVTKETAPDDLILVVKDPVYTENGYSVKVLLNNMADRSRIYLHGDTNPGAAKDIGLVGWYESQFEDDRFNNIEDTDEIDFIIVLGRTERLNVEREFLAAAQSWFNASSFTREDLGAFVVYYRGQNT